MNFLANLSEHLTVDELRPIVDALCPKPRPTRKLDMANAINNIWLADPHTLLALLTHAERLVLSECAHGDNPQINCEQVVAKHGVSAKDEKDNDQPWKKPNAFKCFAEFNPYSREEMLVDGVRERLRELLPVPPPLKVKSVAEVPPEPQLQGNGEAQRPPIPLKKFESERVAPV